MRAPPSLPALPALPAQIEQPLAALARICPRSAPPAAELLARLCPRWGCEQGALPAHSSLTAAGVPLEFGFRGRADEIRYTADFAAPGFSPRAQWELASELLPEVRSIEPRLSRVTGQSAAEAGLWLGVRHRGPATAVKLYQRVHPERAGHVMAVLTRAGLGTGQDLVPILAGADSSGALEIYARLRTVSRASVHAMLGRVGAAAAFRPIELCLAGLRDRSPEAAWGELRVGISWRLHRGCVTVTTLFFHGVELVGDDRVARERLLALGGRLGAGLRGYREVTDAIFGTPAGAAAARAGAAGVPVGTAGALAHGIIGLSAGADGEVELTVAVAAIQRISVAS